jgi:hypothetical protein
VARSLKLLALPHLIRTTTIILSATHRYVILSYETNRIRFKKLCNGYILKILKFKENYIIKKAYIEEINKDRDKLVASSSPRNSTIRYLL